MALQWTSTLSVGVPEIDAQHQELFRRVDWLLDAVLRRDRVEAAAVLGWLDGFVQEHFAAEERLMAESGFPEAEQHVQEHRAFAKRLTAIAADHAAQGPSAAVVYALEQHAVGWLMDHVYFADVALGRWVLARQAAAGARAAC